jgi:hypothetical protein
VSIGTDTFVSQFVGKTCRDIIEDVEKIDVIEDVFIHFQLLRFCQATRLQYLNSHIILDNRCVLHQQHVDCTIIDVLLKKDTKQHVDGWDTSSKDWTHMVLHLPHAEGGFGVPFNCVTKDAAFYTTTPRFVSWMGGHHPRLCSFVTFTPRSLTSKYPVRLQRGLCAVSVTGQHRRSY